MNISTAFRSIIILPILFSIAFNFTACSKKDSDTNSGPTIISLSINSGPYDTRVVITGTGFSSTAANDQIFFNNKAAIITAATANQLTVTVPIGAGTGPISVSVDNGTAVTGPVFTYQLTAVVSTYAGNGVEASTDGTGTSASLDGPIALTFDAADNLYVIDCNSSTIRKISAGAVVTTIAGSGKAGYADGVGTAASFNYPQGLTIDQSGNLYIADNQNGMIRKITSSGLVSTIAGGHFGYADGTGNAAGFRLCTGVQLDAAGNLFVEDAGDNAIRKITPDGMVTTFAGAGPVISGAKDGTGINATFNQPGAGVFDAAGNLYVVDVANNLIREITPAAVVTTFAGGNKAGKSLDGKGSLASFSLPTGIAIDATGNFYITDTGNSLIRKITPNGLASTIAGNLQRGLINGTGTNTSFSAPEGIAIDKEGNIFVADYLNNLVRKIVMQ